MKIEKNIPAPEYNGSGRDRWPFKNMEVNDSVFFQNTENSGNIKGIIDASHNYAAHNNKKFVSRKQPCGGVRIWRVK